VLDLVLPRRCAGCGLAGCELCARCLRGLLRLRGPRCARCGAPTAWPVARCTECAGRRLAFAVARAAVAYAGPAKPLVRAWKEEGRRGLAEHAADLVVETVDLPDVEAITFVPPDPDRLLRRGRHPARDLAAGLAERWALPLVVVLARRSSGRRQRGLTLDERRRNVRGAYAARGSPRRVALVDDVYTTGATADACASALRKAGATHVEVVTFARAVR
jgi:predicted amidophosphoribosyltransferase